MKTEYKPTKGGFHDQIGQKRHLVRFFLAVCIIAKKGMSYMKNNSLACAHKVQTSSYPTDKSVTLKENNHSSTFEPLVVETHLEHNSTDGVSKFTIICIGHGKTVIILTTIVIVAIVLILIMFFASGNIA